MERLSMKRKYLESMLLLDAEAAMFLVSRVQAQEHDAKIWEI